MNVYETQIKLRTFLVTFPSVRADGKVLSIQVYHVWFSGPAWHIGE